MATKPKPKGWNSLTKAQQEAWKKKNFNPSTKVTEVQLNKLRKEGTPTKAITKYKSDPSMREALNRFYGKDRVNAIAGTAVTDKPKGTLPKGSGPGNTRPKTRPGGPGAKTGFDGRMSSSTKKKSSGPSVATQLGAAAGAIGVAALGAKAITSADKKKKVTRKAIGPGPIGKAEMAKAKAAAAAKKKGKYAAGGKTVKTPLTRATPGKYAAPKTSNLAKLGKAGKIVGKAGRFAGLNTPLGRAITVASFAAPFIKPLNVKGNNKRIAPMGNPPKKKKK